MKDSANSVLHYFLGVNFKFSGPQFLSHRSFAQFAQFYDSRRSQAGAGREASPMHALVARCVLDRKSGSELPHSTLPSGLG
jgi:hypothetical protein